MCGYWQAVLGGKGAGWTKLMDDIYVHLHTVKASLRLNNSLLLFGVDPLCLIFYPSHATSVPGLSPLPQSFHTTLFKSH